MTITPITAAAAGKPLRADAARNRARILTAATQVFAERGLDAGLEEIASRAGVGVGTLYRRFCDRDQLIEALFLDRVADLVARVRTALANDDAWEGLLFFLETTCHELAVDRGLRQLFLSGHRGGSGVHEGREQLHPLTAELVARAQAQGTLRSDVSATDVPLIFLMLSTVGDFAGELEPDLWRRYFALIVAGLRVDPEDHLAPALTLSQMQSAMFSWKCRA